MMRWLETVALGFFVYELTGSPFWVAFVGFLRLLPMLALGALVGMVADRIDRRLLLISAMALLVTTYAALSILGLTDRIMLWHVATGAFLAGLVWTVDFPVRRAMIAEVVGPERLRTAMGLEMATSNFSRVLGPLAAGAFLATVGMAGAYLTGLALFIVCMAMAFTLVYRSPATQAAAAKPLENLIEGFRYVRSDAVIVTTLVITVAMNVFAFPYAHMVPVIAEETLGVGAIGLGLLFSMEGAGATLGALLIASKAKQRHYTRAYLYGSILFLIGILVFSRAPWYPLALALLFVGGFGMAAFGTLQTIILISTCPAEVRGRVLGVLAVAIGAGPIGALQIGLVAGFLGAPMAVMITAIAGIASIAVSVVLYPAFLRVQDFTGLRGVPHLSSDQARSRTAITRM